MATKNRLRVETRDYQSETIKEAYSIVLQFKDQERFYKEKLAETRKRLFKAELNLRNLKDERKSKEFQNLKLMEVRKNPSGRVPSILR